MHGCDFCTAFERESGNHFTLWNNISAFSMTLFLAGVRVTQARVGVRVDSVRGETGGISFCNNTHFWLFILCGTRVESTGHRKINFFNFFSVKSSVTRLNFYRFLSMLVSSSFKNYLLWSPLTESRLRAKVESTPRLRARVDSNSTSAERCCCQEERCKFLF